MEEELLVSAGDQELGDSLNSSRWQLADDLHGPVIAFFVAVEFILSSPANFFIVIHTCYYYKKTLQKSSTLLLFIMCLMNLLVITLYMPFMIVSAGAGEWLFGASDATRSGFCQMQAFVIVFSVIGFIHVLALIATDRCLSITRPTFYRQYVSWRVALGIVTILLVRYCGTEVFGLGYRVPHI